MGDLYDKPSLVTRIAVGKGVGFLIGLVELLLIPIWWPDESWSLRIGVMLWYTTMGGIIGLAGILDHHPVLPIRMPYWFRAPMIGAWMNFLMFLLMYDKLQHMMNVAATWTWLHDVSPIWIIMEGALAGLLIGWLSTRFGGEGKKTVDALPDS